MKFARYAALPLAVAALSACDSQAEREADQAEDRIEQQADASAVAAGNTVAALGLTEGQLLEADLVGVDGTDLGDVEQVRRDAAGTVEGLLVEVEDSNPDRYVVIPIDGLTPQTVGDDIDLSTAMTAVEIKTLPDAKITPQGAVDTTPPPAQ